jgi:hypothetical protein
MGGKRAVEYLEKRPEKKSCRRKTKEDLDEFVRKYNELSEVYNRMRPPESRFRRRPLVEET